MSFSSEKPVYRYFGQEILCHDEGCVDLTQLSEVGSLLFHHGRDANYGSLPIGKITKVWLDPIEHRAKATVVFDEDPQSDLIYQKVKSGSIKGISVGYNIDAYEEVKAGKTSSNGRFQGPCIVATKWTPLEISIEPVPADSSVGIGRALEESEEISMEFENQAGATINPGQSTTPQGEARSVTQQGGGIGGITEGGGGSGGYPSGFSTAQCQSARSIVAPDAHIAKKEDYQREAIEITTLCRDFGKDPIPFLEKNNSLDEVRAAILNELKKEAAPLSAPRITVEADEEDKYRAAATDGLLIRMGFEPEKPVDGANNFRGMSVRDLMVDCAARQGVANPHRMNDDDLMRHTFQAERGVLTDSSAFLSIVNDSMHAVMSKAYKTAPSTYRLWTSVGSNSDFKASTRYRLSASGDMQLITENGEFKNDTVTDEGVETKLQTYGKTFGFGRQTIVNDSLGTVAKAIAAQVRSVERFKNKMCYELLCKNTQIYDGKALFSADHKNIATGADITLESLNKMLVAMAKQTDMSGKDTLNISPRFLVVPIAKQMAAARLIESSADPDGANSGIFNPMRKRFQIISDAVIDSFSDKGFYLMADPSDVDTIEVTYLNGKASPVLESRVMFDQLGIQYRMYADFGVTVLDYRGLAYNPGK